MCKNSYILEYWFQTGNILAYTNKAHKKKIGIGEDGLVGNGRDFMDIIKNG